MIRYFRSIYIYFKSAALLRQYSKLFRPDNFMKNIPKYPYTISHEDPTEFFNYYDVFSYYVVKK